MTTVDALGIVCWRSFCLRWNGDMNRNPHIDNNSRMWYTLII